MMKIWNKNTGPDFKQISRISFLLKKSRTPVSMNFFLKLTSVAWGQVWTQKCAVQKASVDVNISLNKIFFKLNIFVQIHVVDSWNTVCEWASLESLHSFDIVHIKHFFLACDIICVWICNTSACIWDSSVGNLQVECAGVNNKK